MKITINGEVINFTAPLNIEECLEQQGYAGMTVAIAHNRTFVPKAKLAETMLADGDELDIVAPMQGG